MKRQSLLDCKTENSTPQVPITKYRWLGTFNLLRELHVLCMWRRFHGILLYLQLHLFTYPSCDFHSSLKHSHVAYDMCVKCHSKTGQCCQHMLHTIVSAQDHGEWRLYWVAKGKVRKKVNVYAMGSVILHIDRYSQSVHIIHTTVENLKFKIP